MSVIAVGVVSLSHYTDYDLPLPVCPVENHDVSFYQEKVKQLLSQHAHIPTHSIKKIAAAQALSSLADVQFETYVKHHLGVTANMSLSYATVLPPEQNITKSLVSRRTALREEEKEQKIEKATQLLSDGEILTSREIRIKSNQGTLLPDDRLAHEAANQAAVAVGWDDTVHGYNDEGAIRNELHVDDVEIAVRLVEKNINIDALVKQCRGYIAKHYPQWTKHIVASELEHTKSENVEAGTGLETSCGEG